MIFFLIFLLIIYDNKSWSDSACGNICTLPHLSTTLLNTTERSPRCNRAVIITLSPIIRGTPSETCVSARCSGAQSRLFIIVLILPMITSEQPSTSCLKAMQSACADGCDPIRICFSFSFDYTSYICILLEKAFQFLLDIWLVK